MSRSSRSRAQTDPVVALIALVVVGLAISTYAGALGSVEFGTERDPASLAVERTRAAITQDGVVREPLLPAALGERPNGFSMNVTLRTAMTSHAVGPAPPVHVESTTRIVPFQRGPARIVSAGLTVRVWR